jgi:C1A family cysteine protease
MAGGMYGAIVEEAVNADFGERSAKFLYSQCFQNGGGSSMRDILLLAKKQGFALESLCPSMENGKPPSEEFMIRSQDINSEARNFAKTSTVFSIASVNLDIDSFAQAIRDNHGMVFGITGQNGKGWLTAFPSAPERSDWRHWLCAGKAKMINGEKYIGCLNSWGDSIGEQGWQWIGEDYFQQGKLPTECGFPVWSAWTIVVNKNNNGMIRTLLRMLLERLLKGLQ